MVRKILLYPEDEQVLRSQCVAVTHFDHDLGRLCCDLMETMRANNGQGLAAPQIGDTRRVLVAVLEDFTMPVVMVNPWLVAWSENFIAGREGCLSLPRMFMNGVRRRDFVGVRYSTPEGESKEMNLYRNDARVVQHEIDHLDGVLIIDRVSKLIAQGAIRRYMNLRRQHARRER